MEIVLIKSGDFDIPIHSVLDTSEFNEYSSLPSSKQQEWLAGRLAVKQAIINIMTPRRMDFRDVVIQQFPSGQPYVLNFPNLYCSVSDSYMWGAAVAAYHSIGVDLEKVRVHNHELLEYIVSNQEYLLLKDAFNSFEDLLTAIWTIKESVMKAMGVGLGIAPKQVVIKSFKDDFAFVEVVKNAYSEFSEWQVNVFKQEDFFISVAYEKHLTHAQPRISWYNTFSLQVAEK